jgi:hypothetical protein
MSDVYGALSDQARSVHTAEGSITVMPADTGACATDGVIATCPSEDIIAAGQLSAVALCAPDLAAGRVRVFGLVPDGVETVTLGGSAGAIATASVVHDVYVAELTQVPHTVSWVDGGEARQVSLAVPAGIDRPDCMS